MHEHHKQHYALREDDVLVHINDTGKGDGHVYRCPYCKQEYEPKRGDVRAWHFAHKKDSAIPCSYDHYLHTLAEQKIKEWYDSNEEIYIRFNTEIRCSTKDCIWRGTDCSKEGLSTPFNLKERLDKSELEEVVISKNGDKFIADILLSNSTNCSSKLLIEINVTHPCEEKKKQSGLKIIEIRISSEYDIERIIRGNKLVEGANFISYGFSPKPESQSLDSVNLSRYSIQNLAPWKFTSDIVNCLNICNTPKSVLDIFTRPGVDCNQFDIAYIKLLEAGLLPRNASYCRFCLRSNDQQICTNPKSSQYGQVCDIKHSRVCSSFQLSDILIQRSTPIGFPIKVAINPSATAINGGSVPHPPESFLAPLTISEERDIANYYRRAVLTMTEDDIVAFRKAKDSRYCRENQSQYQMKPALAKQFNYKTVTDFCCCPLEITDTPIMDYYLNLSVGAIFMKNRYHSGKITAFKLRPTENYYDFAYDELVVDTIIDRPLDPDRPIARFYIYYYDGCFHHQVIYTSEMLCRYRGLEDEL